MRLFLLLVVTVLGGSYARVERTEWEAYKTAHGKSYTTAAEELRRMEAYAENKAFVEQHMQEYAEGKHTFTVALNKFADLTAAEFSARFKGWAAAPRPAATHAASGRAAPEAVDWRTAGVVTAVKDQGPCGSCWAFSAVGALESAWQLAGHPAVTLSEQQLLDCSAGEPYRNLGCGGGHPVSALDYVRDAGGIASGTAYPYEGAEGACRADPALAAARVRGHIGVRPWSESHLQDAVAAVGPVSVVVDASRPSFQLYAGGVYREPRCSSLFLDHAVVVVGYGAANGTAFWTVKNSWGADWGEDGYIRMVRNEGNHCGIASRAMYPLV